MTLGHVDFGLLAGDTAPIAPGKTRTYTWKATHATKIDGLVFFRPDPSLFVEDIRVASRSQFLNNGGPLPCSVLDIQSVGLVTFDTLQTGETFLFIVRNHSGEPSSFSARLLIAEAKGGTSL